MPGTSQTDLFGRVAWTPSSDTDTSLEAAHAAVPTALTDEQRVFAALRKKPDTDEGLCERLKLGWNTVRPRRRSLVQKDLVEHTGKYGQTKSGRRAKVWGPTATAVGLLVVGLMFVGCCSRAASATPVDFYENCYWHDKAGASHITPECWEHWTP